MNRTRLGVAAAAVLVAVVAAGFLSQRAAMAEKREAISASWAKVDAELARRAALIPSLVRAANEFVAQDAHLVAGVVAAHRDLQRDPTRAAAIEANQRLSQALGRLLEVRARDPEWRSAPDFTRLQNELADVENSIAVERRRYNQAVQDYNTYLQLFPNYLAARTAGFERDEAYFRTSEEDRRAAPPVGFSAE